MDENKSLSHSTLKKLFSELAEYHHKDCINQWFKSTQPLPRVGGQMENSG